MGESPMSLPATAPEHVADLLNQWYVQIELGDLEESGDIKKEIEGLLDGMEEDQTVLLYYSLLDYRYQCRLKEKEHTNKESSTDGMDALLTYYFYFYKGMHAYKIRAYEEAVSYYQQAEKRLEFVADDIEKGQFYYNVASVYYQICRAELSMQSAYKALAIFKNDPHYTKRVAHCKIIIALNLADRKEFSNAVELLHESMETAIQENDRELQSIVCHNLGLVYKEKGEPETSIHWLLESTKFVQASVHTLYLLAEASCLANQFDNADRWIEKGMTYCNEIGRKDYWYRFRILKVRYGSFYSNLLEKVLSEAVTYFYQEKIWQYVAENAPYLIEHYEKTNQFDEANEYKKLVSLANRKLTEEIKD
jgi:tetratricopeptide (TPR) repeat protein